MTPQDLYQEKIQTGALQLDTYQERAIASFQRLHADILAKKKKFSLRWKKPVQGIYLYGGVGRGKSMLMDMFFESLPGTLKKRRVHFHSFMIETHDWLHRHRSDSVDNLLPRYADYVAKQVSVLCFDEFHVRDVADAMILGRLFTALLNKGVIVVATSNWPPDRLYEGGLQRELFLPFIELIKSRLEIVHLDSPTDYRLRTLQDTGVYFWPLGRATSEKADTLFTRLTDNVSMKQDVLNVRGRAVNVPAVGGVARLSFSELCEQPRGAEDYLAIAGEYHTVLLEGIPKMGYDRRNEAKRLMTLIDVLYDKSTRLVITADAPAEKLYYGHDHAFEFERTVSRLIEMQSSAYLLKTAEKAKTYVHA